MISRQQENKILGQAYLPEHIISLMVGISQGEPFLITDYVFLTKDDWLIFVGFPLGRDFSSDNFVTALHQTRKKYRPVYTWFIAPEIPESLMPVVSQRESDEYFKLELQGYEIPKGLKQTVAKAAQELIVEESPNFSPQHASLTKEFLARETLPPRVNELFQRLPDYISYSSTSLVLSARDKRGNLSAYFVLESGAAEFLTYVAGCYSKKNYAAHASDLLFYEMINLAQKRKKKFIHLGLGVNQGIRRFKRKWGGIPFFKYESAEITSERRRPFSWLGALEGKL